MTGYIPADEESMSLKFMYSKACSMFGLMRCWSSRTNPQTVRTSELKMEHRRQEGVGSKRNVKNSIWIVYNCMR